MGWSIYWSGSESGFCAACIAASASFSPAMSISSLITIISFLKSFKKSYLLSNDCGALFVSLKLLKKRDICHFFHQINFNWDNFLYIYPYLEYSRFHDHLSIYLYVYLSINLRVGVIEYECCRKPVFWYPALYTV